MPQGRSGVTSNTASRLILDAGAVYANIDLTALEDASASDPVADAIASATLLGATRGGNSWSPGRTLRDIPLDGIMGPWKGGKRRQEVRPTLTVNLIEMTPDNLQKAIAGANSTTAGSFTKITGGEVEAADYLDNLALITTYTGSDTSVIVGIQNAIAPGSPEFSLSDEDEVVMAVTFEGNFDGAAATTEPWFIHHPGNTP